MIRLVLADIDNTLIPHGRSHASDRTMAAIHACVDAGVVFCPATGRNRIEVAGFLHHDEAAYRSAVLVNGQEVWHDGRLVQQVPLETEALHDLAAFLRGRPRHATLAFHADGFCDWVGDTREHLMPLFDKAVLYGGRRHDDMPAGIVTKAGVIAQVSSEDQLRLQEQLTERFSMFDFPNTVDQWFDVIPHGWSKAQGVEALERELGVSPDEICVFGDGENDVPLFERVTHSCAVANAVPAAADAARWHVGASAEDGVAEALEQIAQAARKAREDGVDALPSFMR